LLHRIRAESPVGWVPKLNAYVLTRHADIGVALRDHRLETANWSAARFPDSRLMTV
jgi:hypothetical protein